MSLFEYIGAGLVVVFGYAFSWVILKSVFVTQRKRAFDAMREMLNDPENKGYIFFKKGKDGSFSMSVKRRKVKDEYRQFALVMNTINDYWFGSKKNIRNFRADHWEF